MIAAPVNVDIAATKASVTYNEAHRKKIKPEVVLRVERSLRHGLPKPGLAAALKLTPEQLDEVEALLNKYLKED